MEKRKTVKQIIAEINEMYTKNKKSALKRQQKKSQSKKNTQKSRQNRNFCVNFKVQPRVPPPLQVHPRLLVHPRLAAPPFIAIPPRLELPAPRLFYNHQFIFAASKTNLFSVNKLAVPYTCRC